MGVEMKNDFTSEEELQMVKMTLDLARSYGLENEVVWSAMKIHGDAVYAAIKRSDTENGVLPRYPLNESLGKALQEWDI